MPDRRRHRGPHPEDARWFGADQVERLREAVADLSWLLARGYAGPAAVKLVGDRFQLAARQRIAVRRCACTDAQRTARARTRLAPRAAAGQPIAVDGFNILTTIEAAIAGGVLLRGRDGCTRDMASMHGSWKRVAETLVAVQLVLGALAPLAPARVTIVLDRPVANSGRLAALIRGGAGGAGLPALEVVLSEQADRTLLDAAAVIATADSGILDRADRWIDCVSPVLRQLSPPPWLLDLAPE